MIRSYRALVGRLPTATNVDSVTENGRSVDTVTKSTRPEQTSTLSLARVSQSYLSHTLSPRSPENHTNPYTSIFGDDVVAPGRGVDKNKVPRRVSRPRIERLGTRRDAGHAFTFDHMMGRCDCRGGDGGRSPTTSLPPPEHLELSLWTQGNLAAKAAPNPTIPAKPVPPPDALSRNAEALCDVCWLQRVRDAAPQEGDR